jgi:hypothetical protein
VHSAAEAPETAQKGNLAGKDEAKMKLRRIVSLWLFAIGSLLLTTSAILYITPHGRVAYWAGWTFWGLSKDQWTALHINLGLLFVIAGILHTYLNWRPITIYLKNKSRRLVVLTAEFSLVLVVTIVTLVATQLALPPHQWVLDLNEAIKDSASERFGEPPYGHAELSSLQTLARRLDINLVLAMERLRASGYEFEGPRTTLLEIAEAHGVTPQVVWEAMQPDPSEIGDGPPPMPAIPAPGTGKRTVGGICEEYGFELGEIIAVLSENGLDVTADETLKEIGDRNDTSPGELYEMIRQSQQ